MYFPDVQFIITTHDEVWARQMQSSGLIGRRSLARFHGWTVDGGPVYGQGQDVWHRSTQIWLATMCLARLTSFVAT